MYRERIRTNCDVNSQSVENMDIRYSQNSSEFNGNESDLSNHSNRSRLRQTSVEESINAERRRTQAAKRGRYRERIRTNCDVNSQSVENVDIPNFQNSSEFSGNDSNLSNHRSRSRLRQTSAEELINAERRRTQAAKKARRYRERIRTNCDVNSQSLKNVNIPYSQNSSEFSGNDSDLSNHSNRSRLRQTSGEESINAETRHTQAAKRARRYRERIRTNCDVNSQSVENMDIRYSQNSSEFNGNDSDLSNHRSRSRLRQTSGERSINAERGRTLAAERARRYRERIRTNREVNSQSVENVDIRCSQNSSEFNGNDSDLSNHRSRSRLRQEGTGEAYFFIFQGNFFFLFKYIPICKKISRKQPLLVQY